jgi:hypothetical protein
MNNTSLHITTLSTKQTYDFARSTDAISIVPKTCLYFYSFFIFSVLNVYRYFLDLYIKNKRIYIYIVLYFSYLQTVTCFKASIIGKHKLVSDFITRFFSNFKILLLNEYFHRHNSGRAPNMRKKYAKQ